jgi:hypothetical protein
MSPIDAIEAVAGQLDALVAVRAAVFANTVRARGDLDPSAAEALCRVVHDELTAQRDAALVEIGEALSAWGATVH